MCIKNDDREYMYANLIHTSPSILMSMMQHYPVKFNSIVEHEVVMCYYEFEKSQILIYGRFSIEVLNNCNHSFEIVDFPLF